MARNIDQAISLQTRYGPRLGDRRTETPARIGTTRHHSDSASNPTAAVAAVSPQGGRCRGAPGGGAGGGWASGQSQPDARHRGQQHAALGQQQHQRERTDHRGGCVGRQPACGPAPGGRAPPSAITASMSAIGRAQRAGDGASTGGLNARLTSGSPPAKRTPIATSPSAQATTAPATSACSACRRSPRATAASAAWWISATYTSTASWTSARRGSPASGDGRTEPHHQPHRQHQPGARHHPPGAPADQRQDEHRRQCQEQQLGQRDRWPEPAGDRRPMKGKRGEERHHQQLGRRGPAAGRAPSVLAAVVAGVRRWRPPNRRPGLSAGAGAPPAAGRGPAPAAATGHRGPSADVAVAAAAAAHPADAVVGAVTSVPGVTRAGGVGRAIGHAGVGDGRV